MALRKVSKERKSQSRSSRKLGGSPRTGCRVWEAQPRGRAGAEGGGEVISALRSGAAEQAALTGGGYPARKPSLCGITKPETTTFDLCHGSVL